MLIFAHRFVEMEGDSFCHVMTETQFQEMDAILIALFKLDGLA
jgi:hypothetical protein